MRDYYGNSIKKLKELLKEKHVTKEEWNEYKTGKPLFGATSIMWIYAETEDWEGFINKLKKD